MKMKTFFTLLIVACLMSFNLFGQTDYRTKKSGNWEDVSTWQVKIDTGWVDATEIPSAASNVDVRTKHEVILFFPHDINYLEVSNNGILTLNAVLTVLTYENKGTINPIDNLCVTDITTDINYPKLLNETFNVYSSQGILKIEVIQNGMITVYNLSSQKLYSKNFSHPGYYELFPKIKDGIYIISFRSGAITASKKIFFKN